MRRKPALVATLLVALTMLVAVPTAASAGSSQCSSGYECLWSNTAYTGSFRQAEHYMDFTWPDTFNDIADSAISRGNYDCPIFWEHVGYTGRYFWLSRPARGGQYEDPTLSNGAGYGDYAGENWANRISSANWISC